MSPYQTPYEARHAGVTIHIEKNPDSWRGGYLWTLTDDGSATVVDEGLAFTFDDAKCEAEEAIDQLPPAISS